MLYAQNGDRIVATDSVTSLHPIYFYNNKLARMHGTVKLTKRHAKPVGIASRLKIRTYNVVLGSSPGYPPSSLLMIVNWSVIFCLRSTCTFCRTPPSAKCRTNAIIWFVYTNSVVMATSLTAIKS